MVENRPADAVERWIGAQPAGWRDRIVTAAMDPYHGNALALRRALPAAEIVVDAFLDWADQVDVGELTRLASTVRHWRHRVLAYHRRRLSNGRTEAMNLLMKKVKRVGFGFRKFENYRIRLLLHCDITWDTPTTARIRGRSPRSAA